MRSPFHYDVLLCSILFNFAGQTEQCQQSPSSCATSPHSPPLWPPVSDRCFMMWLDVMLCIALHSIYWDYWVGAVAVPVRPILNASSEIICLLNPFFVSLGIDIIRVFQDCYSTSSTSYKTRHHFPPNQRLQHLRTGDWVGNLLFRQASSILHIHVPAIKLVSLRVWSDISHQQSIVAHILKNMMQITMPMKAQNCSADHPRFNMSQSLNMVD